MKELTEAIGHITSYTEWIMLVLTIGGGCFLVFYSRFKPYLHIKHAIDVIRGKYDHESDSGQVSHFQALSSVVASTVGLGNISGVAIAIYFGGPGVVFWMWLTAIIGASIKFYSCGLAILLREKDEHGNVLGGPMYYMKLGLKQYGRPLAVFFSIAGLVGVLPAFTANQLTQSVVQVINPEQYLSLGEFYWKLVIGVVLTIITIFVIYGGLKSIVKAATAIVPFMVVLYMLTAVYILATNAEAIAPSFKLIFTEAFNIQTATQGGLWGLILLGIRRAVFSNESGVGNAPMYHGQSKTNQPVHEGLVAMLGPFIDTIIVCTITALIIIISGVYIEAESNGIALTLSAFEKLMHGFGDELLMVMIICFGISTLFTYSYYGTKCLNYLAGPKIGKYYNAIYIISIIFAAVASVDLVVGLIDLAFALMSIPNMIAVLWLAPKMNLAMNSYFNQLKVKHE
ncbi:alanine or glycine:cation symporter, AGCS family [Zhouia amylolytica]|uniref:Alanine or glycine:cation symporter, AGCS family n=1 Tax=Zhouia amylolytica TaxID=376730 RepID=A0A1I6VSD9_9FLAO|nr:alanine/glycine:cation symporter family protein [Zhouia amylolytica]SFT16643.1 alanine or glycine:cation symporter, AGCS family [Zhouia amylolytica]